VHSVLSPSLLSSMDHSDFSFEVWSFRFS
jgi:hypothetical protein